MSATDSGYGFIPVKRSDGMPYAGATDAFLITPAGVAQNIFYGSVVEINAGYVQLASGTGADATTNNLGGNGIGFFITVGEFDIGRSGNDSGRHQDNHRRDNI